MDQYEVKCTYCLRIFKVGITKAQIAQYISVENKTGLKASCPHCQRENRRDANHMRERLTPKSQYPLSGAKEYI